MKGASQDCYGAPWRCLRSASCLPYSARTVFAASQRLQSHMSSPRLSRSVGAERRGHPRIRTASTPATPPPPPAAPTPVAEAPPRFRQRSSSGRCAPAPRSANPSRPPPRPATPSARAIKASSCCRRPVGRPGPGWVPTRRGPRRLFRTSRSTTGRASAQRRPSRWRWLETPRARRRSRRRSGRGARGGLIASLRYPCFVLHPTCFFSSSLDLRCEMPFLQGGREIRGREGRGRRRCQSRGGPKGAFPVLATLCPHLFHHGSSAPHPRGSQPPPPPPTPIPHEQIAEAAKKKAKDAAIQRSVYRAFAANDVGGTDDTNPLVRSMKSGEMSGTNPLRGLGD